MSDKETVMELLKHLPPDVSIHQIMQEIQFIAAIQDGLNQINQGQGVSIEKVEQMIESWISV